MKIRGNLLSALKIYSNESWLFGFQPALIMWPFWDHLAKEHDSSKVLREDYQVYDEYKKVCSQFFNVTNEEDAEVAVLPVPWEKVSEQEVRDIVDKIKLKLLIFSTGDDPSSITIDNTIVFRCSYHKPWCADWPAFGFPAFGGDLLTTYTDWLNTHGLVSGPLEKTPKPKIGFCGYCSPPIRDHTLHCLSEYDEISTNFIRHNKFWAGVLTGTKSQRLEAKKSFVQNIVSNHYTICVRGNGNFTYRLGETLSCGRIPIFVNTDCLLPVDTIVDWKKYCVWVDEDQIENIGEIVVEHYNSYDQKEFLDLQKRCRKFWKEYISPEGFYSHLGEIIRPCL
jgi:hypothetical protein